MFCDCMPMLNIIRVKNNLDEAVDKVTFSYHDSCIAFKNIKSKEEKRKGIKTSSDLSYLLMCVDGKEYFIKKHLFGIRLSTMTIHLDRLEDGHLQFRVEET